jgi:hypothetical protein
MHVSPERVKEDEWANTDIELTFRPTLHKRGSCNKRDLNYDLKPWC